MKEFGKKRRILTKTDEINNFIKTPSLNVNKRIKLNFKRGRRQLVIDKTKNVSQDILNFNKNLNINNNFNLNNKLLNNKISNNKRIKI